jgi:hypothetical protein
MSLVTRVGIIWGLWRLSTLHFRLNVPPLGLNATLEGHDITLGGVFRCLLIFIMSKLNFIVNWPGRLYFDLKIN